MARKRTIDPDFWTDEKVQNLPWAAVAFQIGLISFADDDGRLEWSLRQLSARIVGQRDDVSRADIASWMEAIEREKLVQIYEVNGKKYAYHPAWEKHQYVNKRTPSKLPPPPTEVEGDGIPAKGKAPKQPALGEFHEENSPTKKVNGTEKDRKTTGILPEYGLNRIGEVLELPVPLVSVSVLVSESDSDSGSGVTPAGAGEPRRGEPCLCDRIKASDTDCSPNEMAHLFQATFANCRAAKSRRSKLATWTAWLRAMRETYSWPEIWAAFAQAHRDGNHAPVQNSSAAWTNLRTARARSGQRLTPLPPREVHGYLNGQRCAAPKGKEPNGWTSVPPRGAKMADVWPEHKTLAVDYEAGAA